MTNYEDFVRQTFEELSKISFVTASTEEILQKVEIAREGLWLEFGVANGGSLRQLAAIRGAARVYGFDAFRGLPEDWRPGYSAGMFACSAPSVAGATIIDGWFSDTLPKFVFDVPVTLVHIDCDLYSSTLTALRHVGPHLAPGAVIMFDELTVSDAINDKHELTALYDMVGLGMKYKWIVSGKATLRAEGPFGTAP